MGAKEASKAEYAGGRERAKLEIKFAADTDFQKQLFLQFDMFLIDFVSFRLCFFFGNLILQRRRYTGIALAQDEILFSACFLSIQPHGKVLSLALPHARTPFCTPRPASTRLALVSFFMRHMCQSFHKASTHTHTLTH